MPVAAGLVIGLAGVVYPISTTRPLRNITEQRGFVAAIRDACATMGDHAAIVLLQSPSGLLYQWAPQTLRGWCNAPVAVMPTTVPDRGAEVARLAAQWSKAGRTLWVVADLPATIHGAVPGAKIHRTPLVTNPYFLQRTLLHRPAHYVPEPFSLLMAPAAAGPGPG